MCVSVRVEISILAIRGFSEQSPPKVRAFIIADAGGSDDLSQPQLAASRANRTGRKNIPGIHPSRRMPSLIRLGVTASSK